MYSRYSEQKRARNCANVPQAAACRHCHSNSPWAHRYPRMQVFPLSNASMSSWKLTWSYIVSPMNMPFQATSNETKKMAWARATVSQSVSRRGGATKGGVSKSEQMQTNADNHWQTQANAEVKTQAKRKQTRANASKREQTQTNAYTPFIAVSYNPVCNPLSQQTKCSKSKS